MSLINDALKRARQVQNSSPAPHIPGPPAGGPDSTASESESGGGLFGTVGLVSVVLIAIVLLWISLRGGSDQPTTVQARTQDAAAAVQEETPLSVSAPPAATVPAAPLPQAATPSADVAQSAAILTNGATPAPKTLEPVHPPPALKLQAVVFNPRRPSAIINGRTLFIGDRIQEMRVISITADCVTLAGAGRTNQLTLLQ